MARNITDTTNATTSNLVFLEALRGKRVVLTFHSQGDIDGVASAFALKSYLGPNAEVVPVDSINSSAKKILAHAGLGISTINAGKPHDYETLVVLDCSSRALLGKFANERAYAVIDHHSFHSDQPEADHLFIDEHASSTCEIVYEFLRKRSPPNPNIALLLAAGIVVDSAHFMHSRERTFTYLGELLALARIEYADLLELLEKRPDFAQRMAMLKACQRATIKTAGEYIVTTSRVSSFEASAAEALLSAGADVAFVGFEAEDGRISGRTTQALASRVRLTEIMAQAGALMGGSGGGHPCAAGANGPKKANLDDALELCAKLALERLGKIAKNTKNSKK